MPPKQPTTTTQISEVKLPEWVENAAQSNYDFATQIAAKPYEEYEGRTVAGQSSGTTAAIKQLMDNLGAGSGALGNASNVFSSLGRYNAPRVDDTYRPQSVTAGQFAGTDLSPYLNPWIDNVEKQALGALDRQRTQSLMGNSDRAAAAGAFGGSRHGIVDAVTNSESAQSAGLLSADLRRQGFDAASSLAVGDIDRRFTADRTNQAADITGAQMRQQAQTSNQSASLNAAQIRAAAANGLISTAQAEQMLRDKNVSALSALGLQQQGQEQRELDDAYSRWQQEQGHDTEQLNVLLSALGMSPYGKSESGTKETSGGGGTDFAQLGLGALSLMFGLFSDREDKTDINKLGKDPATGLDLYAYRYKDDPKSYPKVVGPMAQDIEKKFPGMTREVGGHKMVKGVLANA